MALQFSDTSTKLGLIQECEDLVFGNYGDISGNTDRLYQFTRLMNEALNRVTSLILKSDGRWQFDDSNNTDLPIGTTDLVTTAGSEQQDYEFSVSHLKVLGVEVLNADGNWVNLSPLDQLDLVNTGNSVTDYLKTPGMPQYYDKIGRSIFLYPKPLAAAVTETGGLKVRFQRPPSYFVYNDTTKVPGFNSLYHRLVALIASRDYALSKSLKNAKSLAELTTQAEEALVEDYMLRNGDERINISSKGRRSSFN
jgi:hypothetical protein